MRCAVFGRWVSGCFACLVSSTKLKHFSLTGISNLHSFLEEERQLLIKSNQAVKLYLLVGGHCWLRPDGDEDVAHDVGGGPGGELIKRPTSTTEARPLDRRALIKLRRAAASKSRLRSGAHRLRTRPSEKLHRHAVWSGPAMLWAGVSTNVLIRWRRKLQVLFCRGKKKVGKTDGKVDAELPPLQLEVGQSLLCVSSSDI